MPTYLLICIVLFFVTFTMACLDDFEPPVFWVFILLLQAGCVVINLPGVLPS